MSPARDAAAAAGHAVRVRRILDAPAEKVWRAWTEPEAFAQWFGTPPFETPADRVAMDVRPGGEWRATQVSETEGVEIPFVGHYREVDEPQRLVFTFENPDDPDDPKVEVATVELYPLDGMTEMTVRQEGDLPPEQYQKLAEGYSRFFDRMEEYLRRA